MTRDMQDNLKEFVRDNRSEFDSLSPKDEVWKGIHNELENSKRANNSILFWRAAAIILFVFSIGLTFYANRDSIFKSDSQIVYGDEFLNTEKYYTSVINERQELITLVATSYPDIKNDFELDWIILDENYTKLKEEFSKSGSREVLNALVKNLQSRVNLLNSQIEVLKSLDSGSENILEI